MIKTLLQSIILFKAFLATNSTKCQKPDSFLEFNLPAADVPYSGTLHLSGDGVTAGSIDLSGTLDMKIANNSADSTAAVVEFNSLDLSNFHFVFENESFEPFTVENLDTCGTCSFRARLPASDLPVCPFKTNLILLLDGDLTTGSGHAVTFIAKTVSDSLDLGFNKSEASLVGYGQPGPEKTITFTDEKNNRQVKQAINNYTVLNAEGKRIPEGLGLVNEIFLTEARASGQDVLVFITDGFNYGKVNPQQLATELANLRTIANLQFFIVAVAGDESVYRQMLGCSPTDACPHLIVLPDISRASAEIAAAEVSEKICILPSKKDQTFIDPESATLLTFTVKDQEHLSTPSLQSVANSLIREAAHEYNINEKSFEVLSVENVSGVISGGSRQLSEGSSGVLKIAMLNDQLGADPTAIAQSLGQKLNQRGSQFASKLREQTGAQVLLQDFELTSLASNGKLRDSVSNVLQIENLLQNNTAQGILNNLQGFF